MHVWIPTPLWSPVFQAMYKNHSLCGAFFSVLRTDLPSSASLESLLSSS